VTNPDYYQEFPESDFEPSCYNFVSAFSLTDGVVSFSLDAAKESAYSTEKTRANLKIQQEYVSAGLTSDFMVGPASQDPTSRPARFQNTLDAIVLISNQLNDTLDAIDEATTIDEINNIVYPPTGIIFTGRGAGDGPQDLNISDYTVFDSVSLTEAETELYVPGTDTVIPYVVDPETGIGSFDSGGDCFNVGDYLIQIRQVSDSRVIAEFEVPLNPDGQDVPF
jgi:hypothetical protein